MGDYSRESGRGRTMMRPSGHSAGTFVSRLVATNEEVEGHIYNLGCKPLSCEMNK